MPLSASRVDRAGQTLRAGDSSDPDKLQQAFETLWEFRAEHSVPLTTAAMGLRSAVSSCGYPVKVSQRLKRFETIFNKLQRQPNLRLSQLQDVGGCRAVLPDVQAVMAVKDRLCDPRYARAREVKRVTDYITSPRDSGYRGVHVMVTYRGRTVEIQLRTEVMHAWAVHVERLTQKYGQNLREPSDPVLRRYLSLISEAMALEESGGIVSQAALSEIDELRIVAIKHLQGE